MGADETGVTSSLWWMYVLWTDKWTLYHLDPSKGDSAKETMGVLLVFARILVHDKVYFRYVAFHVLCNAHHLGEFNHLVACLQRLLRLAWNLSKGFRKFGMKTGTMELFADWMVKELMKVNFHLPMFSDSLPGYQVRNSIKRCSD